MYVLGTDVYSTGANAQTVTDLHDYLRAKADAKYDKPIFVASHLPLHDGAGADAAAIFAELQTAGRLGLTVIFLYGHNHVNGLDDSMGGAAVYLPVGHDISVPDGNGGSAIEQLFFTYMNAGYTVYYDTLSDTLSGVFSERPPAPP